MSRPTQGSQRFLPVRGYHPLWRAFPDASGSYAETTGLFRFRSPLLTESRLMSFPPGTEMFQFPGFASLAGYSFEWVSPFGNLRINGRSPLPAAYRSVPRPSSPVHAKASTKCSFKSLDRFLRNQNSDVSLQRSAVRCQRSESLTASSAC